LILRILRNIWATIDDDCYVYKECPIEMLPLRDINLTLQTLECLLGVVLESSSTCMQISKMKPNPKTKQITLHLPLLEKQV